MCASRSQLWRASPRRWSSRPARWRRKARSTSTSSASRVRPAGRFRRTSRTSRRSRPRSTRPQNECDWVLVEPGVYDEEVKVTAGARRHPHPRHEPQRRDPRRAEQTAPGGSNGILVEKANDVWIENMTARNYDRETPDGGNGNDFWWSGGDGSGKEGAHGWWGKLPDGLRHEPERRLRDLHPERDGRLLGTHLRLRLQRLGHLHRRLLGMQGERQRRHDRKQRGRLLGLELGRSPRDRKLDLPQQLRRHRAERGKPR